jgi:predicted kinase
MTSQKRGVNLHFRELLQRYIVALGVVFLLAGGGCITVFAFLGATLLGSLLLNLGSTLLGTGLLILIYRLAVADVLRSQDLDAAGLTELPLSRVELFRDLDLASRIQGSQSVSVLGITANSIVEEIGADRIRELVSSGVQLDFLILDPESPLVGQREVEERRPTDYLRHRIWETIEDLRFLRARLPPHSKSKLRVLTYASDYSALVVLYGSGAIFQPYFSGQDAHHSPAFVFRKTRRGVYDHLYRHIANVESGAMDVSSPLVILMYGHTCAGKTDLSKLIAARHSLGLIASYRFREQLFPQLTNPDSFILSRPEYQSTATQVYEMIDQKLTESLRRCKLGVIVDGSFPFRRWRSNAYRIARQAGARIVMLQCHCSDKSEIERRIQVRVADDTLLPTERARSFEVYLSSIRDAEPLADSELRGFGGDAWLISYDSSQNSFTFPESVPDDIRMLLGLTT